MTKSRQPSRRDGAFDDPANMTSHLKDSTENGSRLKEFSAKSAKSNTTDPVRTRFETQPAASRQTFVIERTLSAGQAPTRRPKPAKCAALLIRSPPLSAVSLDEVTVRLGIGRNRSIVGPVSTRCLRPLHTPATILKAWTLLPLGNRLAFSFHQSCGPQSDERSAALGTDGPST